jgi:hypothetical protein
MFQDRFRLRVIEGKLLFSHVFIEGDIFSLFSYDQRYRLTDSANGITKFCTKTSKKFKEAVTGK